MLSQIARYEFISLLRDNRFRVMTLFLFLLLGAGLVLGLGMQRRVAEERRHALEEERENWLEQGDKNPHGAAHDGMYVFKPLSSLAWFDPGLDPWLGTATRLESHGQNHLAHAPAADLGGLSQFGFLTPAWLLQVFVPLIIVLAAAGTVAGERESGVLRQTLALGVPPPTLLFGKCLGLGAALAVPLVPVLIALVFVASKSGGGDDAQRALFATLGYAVYFAVFLLLAVAVSAWARTARTAVVALLAFWMAATLVVPRLAADLVTVLRPLPTMAQFSQAMHEELSQVPDGHSTHDTYTQERVRRLMQEHNVRDPSQLPFNIGAVLLQEGEEKSHPILDRHFGALWGKVEAQNRSRTLLGLLAPPLALEAFSMTMAGTDFSHHKRFAGAAEEHRRIFIRMLNEDMKVNSRFGQWDYQAGRALWEKIPVFKHELPAAAWALGQARVSLLVLGIWLAAAVAAVFLAARKVRPV